MLSVYSLRYWLGTALGLVACLNGSALQAQVALRAPDNLGAQSYTPSNTNSSRQKPVSRESNYGVAPSRAPAPPSSTQFRETSAPLTARDYEFQQLQRQADAMERQLNLVSRIVKFAGPSIVHIEATLSADHITS